MIESDIIIIGGGAAGLIAARELSGKKKVFLLEARNRLGGRIFTAAPENFSVSLEAGAEFIHGDLKITRSILKDADITEYAIEGEIYQVKKGRLKKSGNVIEGLPALVQKAKKLKTDVPFSEFIKRYLNGQKYKEIRESAIRFVEGYDAADINKASTMALSKEWESEGATSAYRIEGGYGKIIEFLSGEAVKSGCRIYYSAVAKKINWKKNNVEIITDKGDHFNSRKILITVPAGVLKSPASVESHIEFNPVLNELEALNSIGYGSVIKVFFEFKKPFWESGEENSRKIHQPGFIISDAVFTAWWSQLPKKIPLLTGWFAGPEVDKMNDRSDDSLIEKAAEALCTIFKIDKNSLDKQIKSKFAVNWKDDPFSLGAYSYATVYTHDALKKFNEPIEDTIFFAGEAYSEIESLGTVEAAFDSGLAAAKKVLKL